MSKATDELLPEKPAPVVTGTATFKFNDQDICSAIQFWLNEKVLKNVVTVSKVERVTQNTEAGFTVTLKEDERSESNL